MRRNMLALKISMLVVGLAALGACKGESEQTKDGGKAPAPKSTGGAKDAGAAKDGAGKAPAGKPSADANRWYGDGISWVTPEGWATEAGATQFSFASVKVNDNLKVSVTRFPGDVGGVHANVNRWRGQVGLERIAEEDIEKHVRKIQTVDGAAMYFDFAGPGGRMLVAMIPDTPDKNRTWFVKVTGTPDQLEAVKETFGKLIESISFSATPPA